MAVRKSHNILALITQGFEDFTHTTITSLRGYISRVPVLQKSGKNISFYASNFTVIKNKSCIKFYMFMCHKSILFCKQWLLLLWSFLLSYLSFLDPSEGKWYVSFILYIVIVYVAAIGSRLT
jgi:hypothetical protein